MRNILYAFFSESSVPKIGSSFYTTTDEVKVRVTHLSKNMQMTDWLGPVMDDYGRMTKVQKSIPEDRVFVGEVWSDSHAFDPDHMSPNLAYTQEFLDFLRGSNAKEEE
jgi:hypothetical protein